MNRSHLKKISRFLTDSSGAGIPKIFIIIAVLGVLIFVLFKPLKNRYSLIKCENRISVIKKYQEKFYQTNMRFAETMTELKNSTVTVIPTLEPLCIRVGEETEYLTPVGENPNTWSIRVTIKGDLMNKCFINADRNVMYREGVCASKKDLERMQANDEQQ